MSSAFFTATTAALFSRLQLIQDHFDREIIHEAYFEQPTAISYPLDFAPAIDDNTYPSDYIPHIQQLLHEIGYHYEPLMRDCGFFELYDEWLHSVFAPASSWPRERYEALGDVSSGIINRSYPYADVKTKMLYARLTTIAIAVDDSMDDEKLCDEVGAFTHRLYLREPQPPGTGILALLSDDMKELSKLHQNTVTRGLAITSWITFIEACLLEKQMWMEHTGVRTSPPDTSHQHGLKRDGACAEEKAGHNSKAERYVAPLQGDALSFPQYLRRKTGVAETYAVAIFKASEDQALPLTKYIKAMPDITFFIEVMNDLLSFYKEELDGETWNLIHLRTQVLRSSLAGSGTGRGGEWTVCDTFRLLCDEVRDATLRVDSLLRLEEHEARGRNARDVETDLEMTIAKQWRAFRDGFISWHIESRRYKLDFLRAQMG